MSYEPTNWKNGDVITADKLNHMEDGIVGSTPVINGLPEVTAEDNGNVLTVVNGAWDKAYCDSVLINAGFYVVLGDYDDGDTLDAETQFKINYALDMGGVVLLTSTNHGLFFGTVVSNFKNFNGVELTISDDGKISIAD